MTPVELVERFRVSMDDGTNKIEPLETENYRVVSEEKRVENKKQKSVSRLSPDAM